MNEEQIEAACREYCRLRGLDPDAEVYYRAKGSVLDPVIVSNWRTMRYKVVEHYLLHCAVQSQQLSNPPGLRSAD